MTNDAPEEIYNDYNFSKIIVRDLFTDDINELHIDNKPIYNRISYYTKKIDYNKSSIFVREDLD